MKININLYHNQKERTMGLGSRLRALRESVGISQEQLGVLMGCSKQKVYRCEADDPQYALRLDELENLKKFGFNGTQYVIGGSPDPLSEPFDVVREKIQAALENRVPA
jgi:transcriptional regulator with XRE-family HTH domain